MTKPHKYPVGIQSFEKLRTEDYLYVDKTRHIHELAHAEANYFFLSRPRRFGKTLLTDTLHCYFDGRKELFQGLAIDSMETEWKKYPVLHFDMSSIKDISVLKLEQELEGKLAAYERVYGRKDEDININQRLRGLIENAYEATGEQVVVLVDEYDAPLLNVSHDDGLLKSVRAVMRNFYSPLKGCYPYIRFVFLTGISKFAQLSIFSELNNIVNISMLPKYAAICGITGDELNTQMRDDVASLSADFGISPDEMFSRLKDYYDGYHFCEQSPDIYNPYSLMLAFSNRMIRPYWFESGTPTVLINSIKSYNVRPESLRNQQMRELSFNVPLEDALNYIPVFYQSGYLTIKDYDPISRLYTLDIPNQEVLLGLMESLLPSYAGAQYDAASTLVGRMTAAVYHDDIEGALTLLQTFLGTVPYCRDTHYEGHYQQMLYIIFTLVGADCQVEEHTANGRIDLTLRNSRHIFVMEIKVDSTAEAALAQIEDKGYARKFALDSLPVIKVGVNFSTDERNITEWKLSEQ